MKRKEIIILVLLAALNFTHILDFMIMMPLGNYLMPFFNISTRQFSFLVAAYTVSAATSGFLAAFYVDGFDRKRVLLFGYTGFLLGTISCGFAPSYHWLLVFRLLAGLFGGLIGAQVLAMVSDLFGYERRARAMGAIMSAFAVASTFGVPFALYLANAISWHAPFLFVGFLGIVIIPLIHLYIPAMDEHVQEQEAGFQAKWMILKKVLSTPMERRALLFSGLVMVGHFMIIPFINPFMEFNNGYSRSVTPMIYLVGGVASFASATILGWIADRYGKLKVFMVSVFLSLFMVYAITHLNGIHFSIVLVLFALWFVLSTGRAVTAQAMISNIVPPQERGSFMSFNSAVQQLGTSMAALIAGAIVQKGMDGKLIHYDWLGFLSIGVLVTASVLAVSIFKWNDGAEKSK